MFSDSQKSWLRKKLCCKFSKKHYSTYWIVEIELKAHHRRVRSHVLSRLRCAKNFLFSSEKFFSWCNETWTLIGTKILRKQCYFCVPAIEFLKFFVQLMFFVNLQLVVNVWDYSWGYTNERTNFDISKVFIFCKYSSIRK